MPSSMPWDITELKTKLARPDNEAVIAYLEAFHPSAHSDVAEELMTAAKGLSLARWHCPNGLACSYILYHVEGLIVALAFGSRNIGLRLTAPELNGALSEGAVEDAKLGEEWAVFELFKADVSTEKMRADLRKWFLTAYGAALRLANPINGRLAALEALLRKYGHHGQANFAAKLLEWRTSEPATFQKALTGVGMWGGAGALWEAVFVPSAPSGVTKEEARKDERAFRDEIIALVDGMEAESFDIRSAKQVQLGFKKWRDKTA